MKTIEAFKKILCMLLCITFLPVLSSCSGIQLNADTGGKLLINEAVSSNTRCLIDDEFGTPDWVEIYNPSDSAVALKGYGLSDNIREPHKWVFPDVSIPAHEYLVVFCAKQQSSTPGKLCTGFGLSKSGESLTLTDPYYSMVDQISLPLLESDVSYARRADSSFGYCAAPTPNEENSTDIVDELDDIIYANGSDALAISEVVPDNTSVIAASDGNYYPYAELVNNSTEPLLLSSYYLSDDRNNVEKWHIPGVTLQPSERILVFFSGSDDIDASIELHATFRLGSSDDHLILVDSSGVTCSLVSWSTDIPENLSVQTDGAYCAYPTPGEPDSTVTFPELTPAVMDSSDPVRLNEVLVENRYSAIDSDGDRNGFAEIFNASQSPVNLNGYYLSDDSQKPFKWALPAVELGANEYLIVFLSGKDRRVDELHASFKSSRSDDAILLTNMNGLRTDSFKIDSNIGDNVSMGRADDGSIVYYSSPTPAAANTTHSFSTLVDVTVADKNSVYISEVCGANAPSSGLADWIELYNGSTNDMNLEGWYLSDDADELQKFCIPSLKVPSGGFAVINMTARSSKQEGVTAPFGISTSGTTLFLSDESGRIADIFATGVLSAGVTAGRVTGDASFARVFFKEPTKMAVNASVAGNGYVSAPAFSDSELYHSSPFQLVISCPTEGAEIFYTTDGSKPTESSTRYSEPISISSNTPVRAVAVKGGLIDSDIVTETYLFEEKHSVPVVCLTADPDDFHTVYSVTDRWKKKEREAYIEFYENDGMLGVAFPCGIRAAGASTLIGKQKSLTVSFRSGYGMSTLNYPMFEGSEITAFKSLVLRNSGQDRPRARLRDSYLMTVMKGLNIEYVETRVTVMYINGEYWGIYDLNENQNEDYLASHYGIDPDKVDIIRRNETPLEGDRAEFKRVRAYALSTDLSSDERFAEFCEWVDVDYFIDYLIAQTFFANSDMFNQKYWRSQDYTVKWRPVYYDLDLANSSNSVTRDIISAYFRREGVPSHDGSLTNMDIYVGLRKNAGWCDRFCERYVYVVLNYFTPDRLNTLLDEMVSQLEPEMKRNISRWGFHSSVSEWKDAVEDWRKCITNRTEYALNDLQKEFEVSDAKMQEYREKALAVQN